MRRGRGAAALPHHLPGRAHQQGVLQGRHLVHRRRPRVHEADVRRRGHHQRADVRPVPGAVLVLRQARQPQGRLPRLLPDARVPGGERHRGQRRGRPRRPRQARRRRVRRLPLPAAVLLEDGVVADANPRGPRRLRWGPPGDRPVQD
ncbi:hypothetical protein ONE63_003279 [Megalurothrips usitatus]|uniref:Uncharacterized protein n=1 Tax=Megalurothrips usitatus TaxID=439358 RepID=A0AAV7XB92_9NEOP|nr:hypothetical protein ONE63_003279 [Megalurothrips usitatus]